MSNTTHCFRLACFPALAVCAALGFVGCGGDETGGDAEGVVTAPPGGLLPPQVLPPSGTLSVSVVDPFGDPLPGAQVTVISGRPAFNRTAETGSDSLARFESVPSIADIRVQHLFGRYQTVVSVDQSSRITSHVATLTPADPTTVALLPVSIPRDSISADRTELDLHVTVVSSPSKPFDMAGFDTDAITPLLSLNECVVYLKTPSESPRCVYGESWPKVRTFEYLPFGPPQWHTATSPTAALLLVEQSQRAMRLDRHGLRWRAARNFVRISTATAAVSFGGQATDPAWAPLLLPPILFPPDRGVQESAIHSVQGEYGGYAPVHEALQSALALMRAESPAQFRPAIVALLFGSNDPGLSGPARQAALAALRQQQRETGIQSIVVASRMQDESTDHGELAELASALGAPLILAGRPETSIYSGDGTWLALDLAARLLAAERLPMMRAVFRLRAAEGTTFVAGSRLAGTVGVDIPPCSFGCDELRFHYSVEIP